MRFLTYLILLHLMVIPSLKAGIFAGTDFTTGSARYRKSDLHAGFFLPWRSPALHEDPIYHLEFQQHTYTRRRISEDTVTKRIIGDIDFFRQVKIGGHFWRTFETSQNLGGYRANGGGAVVAVKGNGWYPRTDILEPFQPSVLDSEWTFRWNQTSYFERVIFPGSLSDWKKLGSETYGFSAAETLRGSATFRFQVAHHIYDQNVSALIKSGRFFVINNIQATVDPELLIGFPRNIYALGWDQQIGRRLSLSGDGERFSYEDGLSSKADQYSVGLRVFLGDTMVLRSRYRSFQPRNIRKSEFKGGDVSVRF